MHGWIPVSLTVAGRGRVGRCKALSIHHVAFAVGDFVHARDYQQYLLGEGGGLGLRWLDLFNDLRR